MREPDGTTDLLCPLCPRRVWISPEDPDASLSSMTYHLARHVDYDRTAAMELLDRVTEVPCLD